MLAVFPLQDEADPAMDGSGSPRRVWEDLLQYKDFFQELYEFDVSLVVKVMHNSHNNES